MRQLYTLVRLHVGSATSKRGILFHEANLNDSACLASHSGQDAFSLESGDLESQIYFTSRTLSGSKSLFASDAGSRQPLPMVPCSALAGFISPAALCLGARVSSLLTPEAANRCQRSLAALSPDLFHQPHFVWEQESVRVDSRSSLPLPMVLCKICRQIYFT